MGFMTVQPFLTCLLRAYSFPSSSYYHLLSSSLVNDSSPFSSCLQLVSYSCPVPTRGARRFRNWNRPLHVEVPHRSFPGSRSPERPSPSSFSSSWSCRKERHLRHHYLSRHLLRALHVLVLELEAVKNTPYDRAHFLLFC